MTMASYNVYNYTDYNLQWPHLKAESLFENQAKKAPTF